MEMLKWGMEIISPASYLPNSNWFLEDQKNSKWTHEENKLFENALAHFDKGTADRWQKVAAMIPGKNELDVLKHYQDLEDDVSNIEAGLIPIPGYRTSSFTLQWVNNRGYDGLKASCGPGGKRSAARPEQERKKGVPWTEDEHRLFLMGLKKYGKGDWRNISRNFVVSRTPTQVASHAQKYFIRQGSGGKDKRRSSIHDITTVNLNDNGGPPSPTQSSTLPMQSSMTSGPKAQDQFSVLFELNQSNEGAKLFGATAPQTLGNLFMSPPYGITSYSGPKLQPQNFQGGNLHETQIGPLSTVFQMQSPHHHNTLA
ncbi:transcription factor DIVARICATA [Aristolochia californica]|uniref:transcription factor DIVARICATA n=1 Tax=Aristolochia californica TaxID=171875 RepID=UPI0035D676EF